MALTKITSNMASLDTLTANNGVLELDDNGTHNGIINVPASLSINIDSDNGATTESFTVSKDKTGINDTDPLFRVKEDGNVSVGIASAHGQTANRTCFTVNGTNDVSFNIGQGGTQRAYWYCSSTFSRLSSYGSIPLELGYADSAKVRLNSGNFTVTTSGADISSFYNGTGSNVGWGGDTTGYFAVVRGGTSNPLYLSHSSTGNGEFLYCLQNTTTRGYIQWNGSSLSLVSTSDYRLKENVEPIANATTRINSLNPVSYDMIESGISGEGFLAHELQEQVPYAVTGTKDEVYVAEDIVDELSEDLIGTPKYQNVSYASLTPLLVKALQESNAKIEALETRIETLENA